MRVCSLCLRCFDDVVEYCLGDGSPLPEKRRGDVGMVAGYRLETLLRSGVKGETYRAHRIECGTICRVTVLPPRAADRERFQHDASIATALVHPQIADIYETGVLTGGELFAVAEEPDGKTLRELLETVGIPQLLTSIQIARQTAEALHFLHEKGLTHGAVRPENIVLTSDVEQRMLVRVKDPDLGGVMQRSIVSNKFTIDSAMDSLRYFSPEQCSNEEVGPRTDVYALGLVLYEMLAGSPPFDASKASTLIEQHRNERPADIKIDNFDLRMLLTHTVTEALSKHPDRRQSSANAFARQLRHIEQLATHVSTPPPIVSTPPPRAFSMAPLIAERETAPDFAVHDVPATAPATQPRKIVMEPTAILEAAEDVAAIEPAQQVESKEPAITAVAKHLFTAAADRISRMKQHRRKLHESETVQSITRHITEPRVENPGPPPDTSAARLESARRAPAKIEWAMPDDVPSIEEAQEVLAHEPAADIAAVQLHSDSPLRITEPAVEKLPQLEIRTEAAKPKPEMDRLVTIVEKHAEKKEEPFVRKPVPNAPKRAEPTPPASAEREVAAAATASVRPIRIPVEQPKTARNHAPARFAFSTTPSDISFFPTLLGGDPENNAGEQETEGAMLNAFYPAQRSRSAIPYRSLVAVAGVSVLAALYLFSSDLAGRYTASGNSDVLAEEETVRATVTNPEPPRSNTILLEPTAARDKAPEVSSEVEHTPVEKPAKVLPAKASPQTSKKEAPRLIERKAEKKPAEAPERPAQKAAPQPKSEREVIIVGRKPASFQNQPNGLTRPRIVKE